MNNRGRKYETGLTAAIRYQIFLFLLICLPLRISRAEPVSPATSETAGGTLSAPVSTQTGSAGSGRATTGEVAPPPRENAPVSKPTTSVQPGQQQTAPNQSGPGAQAGPGDAGENTFVDELHTGISRSIQGTATWMDSFFGNRRYESELNRSYVRFRYNVFPEHDSETLRKPEFQVRIVLPQLQERTHLIFAGTPKEGPQFSAVQTDSENSQVAPQDERNVTAAVEQTVRETVKENFIVRAGLQMHQFTPAIMLAPRYRLLVPLDGWDLRLVEEVMWRSNVGWQSHATADLEHHLPHDLFFRATNEWVWTEHVLGYLYAFSFNLGQPIDSKRGIDYEWVNVFQTDPINELTEVTLRVRYRTQIWREWLYFEVAPQYRFPRDHNFEPLPGVLFRIDMIFGDYKDNH